MFSQYVTQTSIEIQKGSGSIFLLSCVSLSRSLSFQKPEAEELKYSKEGISGPKGRQCFT